jgi:hypothetical protein
LSDGLQKSFPGQGSFIFAGHYPVRSICVSTTNRAPRAYGRGQRDRGRQSPPETLEAFEILAAIGRVVEKFVPVAGFTVFGPLVFDNFFRRVDFFSAAIADISFFFGRRVDLGWLFSHVYLPVHFPAGGDAPAVKAVVEG